MSESLDILPNEVLCVIAFYLNNRQIKAMRCTSNMFQQIFNDQVMLDLKSVKLYPHQKEAAQFLLDRESVGLNSILNMGTGTGKTAIVMWAYRQNPVPTVIILHSKYKIIWQHEMRKHGITLPILTPSQVKAPLKQYKRVIMDEIHQPLAHTNDQNAKLAENIKHCVIWGLTASRISIRRGKFNMNHLTSFFGAPDCIKTLQLKDLPPETKSNFRLPEFNLIDIDNLITGVGETEKLSQVCKFLTKMYKPLGLVLPRNVIKPVRKFAGNYRIVNCRYTYVYTEAGWVQSLADDHLYCPEMFQEYAYDFEKSIPLCINDDGSFDIDGFNYKTVGIGEFLKHYQQPISFVAPQVQQVIIDLTSAPGKRSLIYNDDSPEFLRALGYDDNMIEKTYSRRCELFMEGAIDKLILPPSYNAGFNFGRIDVMIINREIDYKKFHQMIGRINRLDQTNNTQVYIFTSWYCDVRNPSQVRNYIQQYRSEFV